MSLETRFEVILRRHGMPADPRLPSGATRRAIASELAAEVRALLNPGDSGFEWDLSRSTDLVTVPWLSSEVKE